MKYLEILFLSLNVILLFLTMNPMYLIASLFMGGIITASNWGRMKQTWGKNIVFYLWKGIQCFRIYAKPTNPNTPAQQAQRLKFQIILWQALDLLTPILQVYWKKLAVKMTVLNSFMQKNILNQASPPTKDLYIVAYGNLYIGALTDAELNVAKDKVEFTWEVDVGYNGQDTDKVALLVYDSIADDWFINDAGALTRVTGTGTCDVGGSPIATNLYAYIFMYRDMGMVDEIVSTSTGSVVTQGV